MHGTSTQRGPKRASESELGRLHFVDRDTGLLRLLDLLLPTAESPSSMILRSGSGRLSVLVVSGDWCSGSSADMAARWRERG